MELIAAAVAFYAVFMPVFLALEVATPHPGLSRVRFPAGPEAAAAKYLAAHPLKPCPALAAANDALQRIAA
jgi:hypothetical protein